MDNIKLYNVWGAMKSRCYNSKSQKYKDYGERGIEVCMEWRNEFKTFYDWAIKNGYNENLTLDREKVNGNYEPSNCRWVTRKEQQNNRRNNVFITHDGLTHTIKQWADKTGIPSTNISYRYRSGRPIEDIFSVKRIKHVLKEKKVKQVLKESNLITPEMSLRDEYFGFTEMIEKGRVSRATLHRLIKDGKIKTKEEKTTVVKKYSLNDVINNKPRKK